MDLPQSLHSLGAAITLGLGIMALVRPMWAAAFVSLRPEGTIGVSELRATYGGFFAAMGGLALVSQSPVAFTILGAGWAGAAAGRLLSVFADRSRTPKNLGGILFEGAIAALLLWP